MAQSAEALQAALRDVLARHGADSDAAHDVAHADRVWLNAKHIAAGENFDDLPALMAAAYLHDLVTLPKDHPDRARASQMSASAAQPILLDQGFDPEKIAAIQHAIAAHSFSANIPCDTPLARILQDADRIESLGAIGLARCFAVSGGLNRPLFDEPDPFATQRPLDDSQFAVDHFKAKLLRLPDTMQTKTGRDLAQKRAKVLRVFLQNLAVELGHDAPDW